MKRFTAILISQIAIILTVYSQNNQITVSGFINDEETGRKIEGAHIYNKSASAGTTANKSGFYKIKVTKRPAKLFFTHIGYRDTIIEIKGNKNLSIDIRLIPQIDTLAIATITPVIDIIKDKPLYIWDYSFYDDYLLVFGCRNKKITKPVLIIMNNKGDTIKSKSLSGMRPDKLYRDCMDYNHLITKNEVYQIYYDTTDIHLLYPTDINKFHNSFEPCLEELNNKLYLHEYLYRNQVLLYYYINQNDSTEKEVKVVADDKGLAMVSHNGRFHAMGSAPSEADLRFEEMCFFDPIFAPLVKVNDSICIFNYVDDKIEIYSEGAELLNETPICFHKDKHWKEEIFVDEKTGKVYAIFKTEGISTLREINISTGKLTSKATIPNYIYVENIQIRDGILYFLYREKINQEFNKLYKMRI